MNLKNKILGSSALRGLALIAATVVPTATFGEEVTLRSQDGTIDITGEFLDFYDNVYVVRTALGDLRLSAERVRCEGAACPVFDQVDAEAVLAGSEAVGTGVIPLILEGYAGFRDAEATLVATSAPNEVVATVVGDSGFGDDIGSYLINSSSSADAFDALLNGEAEIGMSSRRITPTEARALRDAGAGNMVSADQEHIIAIDSIVSIVHPDNPVRAIGVEDLAKIYSGEYTNWAQLGGPDMPIKVIDREAGTGTQAVFAERVMGERRVTPAALTADSNTEIANMVNAEPGAIGYTGYAFKRGNKALTLVNECGIAMTPDAFSARTEEYALQRRLYLYNRADIASASSKALLDFALSPEADPMIAKAGFIDLGIDRRGQDLDSARAVQLLDPDADPYEGQVMREMLSEMVDYDRLSTTFRFRTGSSKLDERGRIDLERLANYLEGQPAGTRVLFAGFTDSVGPFDYNRNLAAGRAEQIREELRAFAGDRVAGLDLRTAAYGEVAPSACNVSDNGRAINRRVEVWIEASN